MLHSLKSFVKNQEFKRWFFRFLLGFCQDAFFNKSKSESVQEHFSEM